MKHLLQASLALTSLAAASSLAMGALSSETFDTSALATAHGWSVDGDTGNANNNVTWSNTSNAGGSAGEGSGPIRRNQFYTIYADSTLGVDAAPSGSGADVYNTGTQDLHFDLLWKAPQGTYNAAFGFVFFNLGARDQMVGLALDEGGTYWRTSAIYGLNNGGSGTGLQFGSNTGSSSTNTPFDAVRKLSMDYNASTKTISGAVYDATGTTKYMDITPLTMPSAINVNAFGFVRFPGGSQTSNLSTTVSFDNVNYGAVPEPSSSMLLLGALGLLARRRCG